MWTIIAAVEVVVSVGQEFGGLVILYCRSAWGFGCPVDVLKGFGHGFDLFLALLLESVHRS